jgi:hypothetical protein
MLTLLVAPENLGSQGIGIDVWTTACQVMGKRLRDVCGMKMDEKLWRTAQAKSAQLGRHLTHFPLHLGSFVCYSA